MDGAAVKENRAHRVSAVEKRKKAQRKHVSWKDEADDGGKAPRRDGRDKKALAKPGALVKKVQIAAEKEEKKARVTLHRVDRSGGEDAPRIVAVAGPKGVGKSCIIRALVKHYTKRRIGDIAGPVTLVSGRKRRLTFLEVGSDLPSMIDAAKVADLVLLVIDASFGFEMETFEFLNIAATHGMPRVMGILTHLDKFKEGKQVQRTKKRLKDRFWTELYDGAKLFYLSGITASGNYLKREVLNLARFISVTKFRPLSWRNEHPYILADRVEDVTQGTLDGPRRVACYGYIHGCPLRPFLDTWKVHVPGLGDVTAANIELLDDPCPAPESNPKLSKDPKRKRKVSDKERMVYAPMVVDLDGIAYDRDAVYISLPDNEVRFSSTDAEQIEDSDLSEDHEDPEMEGARMVKALQRASFGIDEQIKDAHLQLIAGGPSLRAEDVKDSDELQPTTEIIRRPANFRGTAANGSDSEDNDINVSDSDVGSNPGDDDVSEEDGEEKRRRLDETDNFSEGDTDDSIGQEDPVEEEEDLEPDEDEAETRWKDSMIKRASKSFSVQVSLSRFVYDKGQNASGTQREAHQSQLAEAGLIVKEKSKAADESVKLSLSDVFDWSSDQVSRKRLRLERFVTGAMDSAGEPNSEDSDAYGDFEDLETGQIIRGAQSDMDSEDEKLADGRVRAKMEKKRMFDEAWDNRREQDDNQGEEVDNMDVNVELEKRRVEELDELDPNARREIEGFLPGCYVRLELLEVPEEFVRHFDSRIPLVLGGLKASADVRITFLQARIKRHRWKRSVLKSNDPIIFSIGWRRFQSIPVYSLQDQNKRNRFLKYTPEHMHCDATFWGPSAAPGTKVMMCQALDRSRASFRVSATGLITEILPSPRIQKKLKLVGEPFKIHRNTAFIKGMFTSELEVAKFAGAAIRTVSGIRGSVKKGLRSNAGEKPAGPPGSFRAVFEDKILMSDIVFLRAWVPVEPIKYCETAATLLQRRNIPEVDAAWRMRTLRELREAKGVPIPVDQDSLYHPIERKPRRFAPLKIPKALVAELPYRSLPKELPPSRRTTPTQRTQLLATVMEPREKKAFTIMQMLNTVGHERDRIRKTSKAQKREQRQREREKEDEKYRAAESQRRKRRYVLEAAKEAKKWFQKGDRGSEP